MSGVFLYSLLRWFFRNLSKSDAERRLKKEPNQCGSFLVRESKPGCYSLSIRDKERTINYRIRQLEDGAFFVSKMVTFQCIQDLVAHYKIQPGGLCANLQYPCLRCEKPQTAGLSRETNEKWDIDRHQLRLIKKLGAGGFGEVWEGLWNGITRVAVRTLIVNQSMSANAFMEEFAVMKKLRHPHLLQLYAVSTREDPTYLITEFMKLGSLSDYLHTDGRSLKLHQLIDMCVQIAGGMEYLESHNYTHGSLAAKNVLVTDNMVCKVADHGIARLLDHDEGIMKFPIKWTAPEAAMFNRFTTKSDVWSFGIVLYEVITYGRMPYPGFAGPLLLPALEKGYRMPCPLNCPEKLHKIMMDCWKEEPANRLTFETLQWQLEYFFTAEWS